MPHSRADDDELDSDHRHQTGAKKHRILTSAESPLGGALQPAYDQRSSSANSESRGSSESNSPRLRRPSSSSQEKAVSFRLSTPATKRAPVISLMQSVADALDMTQESSFVAPEIEEDASDDDEAPPPGSSVYVRAIYRKKHQKQERVEKINRTLARTEVAEKRKEFLERVKRAQITAMWATILVDYRLATILHRKLMLSRAVTTLGMRFLPIIRVKLRRRWRQNRSQGLLATMPRPSVSLFMNVEPFNLFEEEQLRAMIPLLQPLLLRKREIIIYQGADSYECYVVVKGSLEVLAKRADGSRSRTFVITPETKAIFGEGMIAGEPRTATVRAIEDCHLWVLKKPDFEAVTAGSNATKAAMRIVRSMHEKNINKLYASQLTADGLKQFSFLSGVAQERLEEIVRAGFQPMALKTDTPLFQPGERLKNAYLVLRGTISFRERESRPQTDGSAGTDNPIDTNTFGQQHRQTEASVGDFRRVNSMFAPGNFGGGSGLTREPSVAFGMAREPSMAFGMNGTAVSSADLLRDANSNGPHLPAVRKKTDAELIANLCDAATLSVHERLSYFKSSAGRSFVNRVPTEVGRLINQRLLLGLQNCITGEPVELGATALGNVDVICIDRKIFLDQMLFDPGALYDMRELIYTMAAEWFPPLRTSQLLQGAFPEHSAKDWVQILRSIGGSPAATAEPFILDAGSKLHFLPGFRDVYIITAGLIDAQLNAAEGAASTANGAAGKNDKSPPRKGSGPLELDASAGSNPSALPPATNTTTTLTHSASLVANPSFADYVARDTSDKSHLGASVNAPYMWPSLPVVFYGCFPTIAKALTKIEGYQLDRSALVQWLHALPEDKQDQLGRYFEGVLEKQGKRGPVFIPLNEGGSSGDLSGTVSGPLGNTLTFSESLLGGGTLRKAVGTTSGSGAVPHPPTAAHGAAKGASSPKHKIHGGMGSGETTPLVGSPTSNPKSMEQGSGRNKLGPQQGKDNRHPVPSVVPGGLIEKGPVGGAGDDAANTVTDSPSYSWGSGRPYPREADMRTPMDVLIRRKLDAQQAEAQRRLKAGKSKLSDEHQDLTEDEKESSSPSKQERVQVPLLPSMPHKPGSGAHYQPPPFPQTARLPYSHDTALSHLEETALWEPLEMLEQQSDMGPKSRTFLRTSSRGAELLPSIGREKAPSRGYPRHRHSRRSQSPFAPSRSRSGRQPDGRRHEDLGHIQRELEVIQKTTASNSSPPAFAASLAQHRRHLAASGHQKPSK